MTRPVHLVVGPQQHGVVQHARRLAQATGAEVVDDPAALTGRDVVVHFTDRLFGADAPAAADRLLGILRGRRAVVVLHDLPQASDGHAADARRRAYARVASSGAAMVVSSEHERRLLAALPGAPDATVIPLPMDRWADGPAPHDATVATLGFIYPGKGLEEIIDAAAEVPGVAAVVNLGGVSPGHEGMVDDLTRRAAERGIWWEGTGWLAPADLRTRLQRVGVPVAAHRHLSASASINTWLEAGRRPVVLRSDYAVEVAARVPGSLNLIEPDRLAATIAAALADPGLTDLAPEVHLWPDSEEACRMLEAVRRSVV